MRLIEGSRYNFFFDKKAAQAAAKEVVKDHASNDQSILQNNFEDTWNHFDVNKDALVEVERMPQFFRYMLGNALAIGL